jgi:hypothetical protein
MLQNLEIQILKKIGKAKGGALFFNEQFLTLGSNEAVRKALERLVKKEKLKRLAQGIYYKPLEDPVIGKLTPGTEAVAKAIAKRDKARIVPTGTYALNRLGLSTQVPLNVIYLTDGAGRKIKIGNRIINFKKTTPRNVAAIGEISKLAIQALKTIGQNEVTQEQIEKIQLLLKKEKRTHLEHDIRLAPEWIRKIMLPVLKE